MNDGVLTGSTLGPYQLLELLGHGSIGAVYHAHHPGLNRHVAIKVLTTTIDDRKYNGAERFALEAQTVASLHHPNIIPIYEYGSDKGFHYIVMRMLTGGTLAERFEVRLSQGLLPSLGETAQLLDQIAGALDFAHDHHVIHRDVKTTNVMFDERGVAFLVDFSIVKLMDAAVSLTTSGVMMGTPSYMSPEQWRGDSVTAAADQYALGVTIYLLVCGRLPFDTGGVHILMYKHLQEDPPPVHSVRPDVPEAVDRVLQWALAKDPADRYPTTQAFAEAFRRAIEGAEGEPTDFFKYTLASEPSTDLPSPPQWRASQETPVFALLPAPPSELPNWQTMPRVSVTPRRSNLFRPLLIGVGIGFVAIGLCAISLLASSLSVLGLREAPALPTQTEWDGLPTIESTAQATQPVVLLPTELPATEVVEFAGTSVITAENAALLQPYITLDAEDASTRSVAFDPNGTWVASGGSSNFIQLWNIDSGAKGAQLRGHSGVIYGIAFSPDGSRIASASGDGTVRLWDSASGQAVFTLNGHIGEARSVAFSPDGSLLASTGQDQTVRLWDAATGAPLSVLEGSTDRVLSAVFSPDGMQLMSTWMNNAVAVWDVSTRSQRLLLSGHSDEVRSLAASPQGSRLASSSADATVRLWDVQSGETLFVLTDHERDVFDVAFTPDGSVLASGGADNNIILWNVETGAVISTLEGHGGWVFDVQFNADGSLLASASGDGTVRLWSLPES